MMNWVCSCFLFLMFNVFPANVNPEWILIPASTITIHGNSNVNSFQCETNIIHNSRSWQVILARMTNDRPAMTLKVANFDCGNKVMNQDFRKTLNEDQYPQIKVYFLSPDRLPQIACDSNEVSGKVQIELAGVKRLYTVNFKVQDVQSSLLKLKGEKVLRFSDFDLEPPTKFLGMVRVKEKLQVSFNLVYRKV